MKIVSREKAENCFDGEFVFKYIFDTGWTDEAIRMMETIGVLRYYESFPRPMFQVNCPDGTIIKGLQHGQECRIIFPRASPTAARERFETEFGKISS